MLTGLSRREKLMLFGLLLLIPGFYYFLLYEPLRVEVESLVRELERVRDQRQLALERIEQIPELERELEELKERKEKILAHRIFKPEEMLVDLMAAIEGVDLEPLGYRPSMVEEGFALSFLLEGDYYSMLEFIRLLEDLDPRLEVTSFEINAEDEDLGLDLELLYHKIEEEEG